MLTVKEFTQILDYANLDYRTDYSGRGMFGKECIAIDVSQDDSEHGIIAQIVQAAAELTNNNETRDTVDNTVTLMCQTHTDSMGLGSILYWPRMVVNG